MITILSILQIGLCLLILVLLRMKRETEAELKLAEERDAITRQDLLFAKRNRILKLLAEDTGGDYGVGLKVGDLMSSFVSTVKTGESVPSVRERMEKLKLRHLLVVDAAGRLAGVISDRDLHKSAAHTAGELMTANPITVSSDTPLIPAITTLITKHISSLPVVDAGQLVGVLTRTDLMLSLQCILQALQRAGAHPTVSADSPPAEQSETVAG
jgi:CBS domain-containing protein